MSLTHFQYVAYRRIDLEKAISGRPIGPLLPLAFAPTFRCDQYAHTHILNFKQLTFCYVVRPTSAVFPLLFLGRLFSFFFCEISRTSVDSCKAKQIGGQEIGSTFQLLGPSHRSPCSSRTAELLRQFANLFRRPRPSAFSLALLPVSVRRFLENRIKIKHTVWHETST